MRTLVIASIFCLALTSVMAADMTQTFKELSKSQFGKAILETIQIQLENKADFRIQINQLLQDLLDQTVAAHQQEEAEWQETSKQCNDDQIKLNAKITELKEVIKVKTARKLELSELISDLESQESSLVKQIEQIDEAISTENTRRQKEREDYEAYVAHRRELIAVLQKVRSYIATRLANRYASASFLEKKANTEILNSLAQIKETVTSAEFAARSPGYSKIVSFITTKAQEAMSDPASYEAADAHADKRFGDITSVIDQFIAKFNNEIKVADEQEEQNRLRHERIIADLTDQKALLSIQLAKIRLDLAGYRRELAEVEGVLYISIPELADTEERLRVRIEQCEQAEKNWNKLDAQRTEETRLIKEVQVIMAELNNDKIRERTQEVLSSL